MIDTSKAVCELWREGTFIINGTVQEDNRCGINGASHQFRYEVRLACLREHLDARGFILDNRAVNRYWIERWTNVVPKVFPSCEIIADTALRDFIRLTRRQHVECIGIEVKVYGGTHSCVTARLGEIAPSQARPEPNAETPHPLVELFDEGDPIREHLAAVLEESFGEVAHV